jgi:hypothetical protein
MTSIMKCVEREINIFSYHNKLKDRPTKEKTMIDLIVDIHGHTDKLEELLQKLGYAIHN